MSIYNRAPKKKTKGPYEVDVARDSSLYIGSHRVRGVQLVCRRCRKKCKVLKARGAKFICFSREI